MAAMTLGSAQGVQPAGESWAQGDGLAAEGPGDCGPLAFGVAGHVDPVAVRDRPGGDGLGQRGLAHADDAGEDRVGVGEAFDVSAAVQRERVVAERRLRVDIAADED